MTGGGFPSGEDDLTTLLENSQVFKALDQRGRERALAAGVVHRFDAGAIILREGEPGEAFYLVKAGAVRVYTVRDDREVHLATLQRGAFFGEVSVLSGQPRTATVEALEPVDVVAFDSAVLAGVLDEYPKVRQLLEAMVLGRARNTIEKLTAV